ncbi:MAG: SPOR domain-containing protein [Magnetospirillum sp.]|nr:SPOR domain-containing protein [Magnetospirillum sp.]
MARPGDDFDRDLLDIIPERFDADADSHQARAGHRLRTGLTLAFAVVAVGAIVAAGLHFVGGRQMTGPGLPVIKADDRPIKVRPDDRGGMQVPNQDKLVYERMDGGEGDGRVERLLPPPEQPKAPPRNGGPTAALPSSKPVATEMIKPPAKGEPPAPRAVPQPKVAVQAVAPPAVVPPIAGPVTAPAPIAPAPSAVKAPPPKVAVAAPPQVAAVTPPPPAAAAPKAPAAGDYVIQLGAVRAADAAEKEWGRIQKANHDLLGALKPDIMRVELEGKGTFWRVRAGPLSEAAARQLCTELSGRGQGCILARK